ncbi:MAG: copper amine oxidase N-terminal domain-containing protein [Armatimonadetes bacterium]|nr:copper amine oxidase N-terminal domain-containing protein [Armatimonadota bacterium]
MPAALESAWPTFQFGGQAMAPMRPIIDWLKAGNSWDTGSGTLHIAVHAPEGRRRLELTVRSVDAALNGKKLTLPRAPFLAHGTVYAPARLVLESLGVKLEWSAEPRGLVCTLGEQQTFLPVMAPNYPLVDRSGVLIGGSMAGVWSDAKTMAAKLVGGEPYWVYTPTDALEATLKGGKPVVEEPGEFLSVPLPWAEETHKDAVAFGGPWDAQPRRARLLKLEGSPYESAIREVLRDHGQSKAPVKLQQAMLVDLDGDGTDEALLSASTMNPEQPPVNAAAGDYSMVLLRRVEGKQVKTYVLAGHFYTKETNAPNVDRVQGLLDLDGDGVMEILCSWRYYEGGGTDVYQLQKGVPKQVLSAGMGA